MMRKPIDEIASEASMILQQIPFSKQGDIAVSTGFSGDPTVSYAPSADGYYETIKERGDSTSYKVANDDQEMQDYFIRKAILAYAYRYEFRHRRKFEDNRRQIDEIIMLCYQYIDPEKAFNHQPYNDKGHIYLDLLDEYRKETYDFRNEHHAQYLKMKDDIDYIADKKYTDSPHGGMSDLRNPCSPSGKGSPGFLNNLLN